MKQSDHEENKPKRRFSEEQYQMLLRCSEKKDMTEWNEWRKKHVTEDVFLEGADFKGKWLKGAKIRTGDEEHEFEGEMLLDDAKFWYTTLDGADLNDAYLRGAKFYKASLKGTSLRGAIVDGSTLIWRCKIDPNTDAHGLALASIRMDPATKQLLEYNIRRMNWEKWYRGEKAHKPFGKIEKRKERWLRACQVIGRLVLTSPVRLFWAMSDYGLSTLRVVGVFFLLAFLFAGIYMNCAYWRPPGIIDNLIVEPAIEQEMSAVYYFLLALVRPIYFSIVTMTTLGFGDMYANKGSVAGHVILAVQVILGYVLLGALITRFAVLFTAGGPAGKFAKQKKKVDSVSPDNGIRGQASTE